MFEKIKIVMLDTDGVLTDGIYQVTETGSLIKSFYTRDFYGIEQLMKNNIPVLIFSQSKDTIIKEQINRICRNSAFWAICYSNNVLNCEVGVHNKKDYIEDFLKEKGLNWENIAYMGDAENDLECMQLVGFSGCPTDAIPDIRDKSTFQSDYYGGKGAVHDFCMYIIEQKKEIKNEDIKS